MELLELRLKLKRKEVEVAGLEKQTRLVQEAYDILLQEFEGLMEARVRQSPTQVSNIPSTDEESSVRIPGSDRRPDDELAVTSDDGASPTGKQSSQGPNADIGSLRRELDHHRMLSAQLQVRYSRFKLALVLRRHRKGTMSFFAKS